MDKKLIGGWLVVPTYIAPIWTAIMCVPEMINASAPVIVCELAIIGWMAWLVKEATKVSPNYPRVWVTNWGLMLALLILCALAAPPPEVGTILLRQAVFTVVWTAYFACSTRVKATYGRNLWER